MSEMQLGAVESRFADIIWEKEPVSSAELVKCAEKELKWKKSTTYTVLKRLCEKGIFVNECGTIRSILSREEFYSAQSERFVSETFDGSLPAFLAAFTRKRALSREEIDSILKLIEDHREG